MDVGGFLASRFTGSLVSYIQAAPGFQPQLLAFGTPLNTFQATFTGFPLGNPSNGVPGNGTFSVTGNIHQFVVFPLPPHTAILANLGSATVSGVPVTPVPEPGFASILSLGIAAAWFAARKHKTQ
ncbi:MAG TPA: hypothetical protein VH640_24550 [Bryobacteraceae bacterium]|jgi:hypothetical protein